MAQSVSGNNENNSSGEMRNARGGGVYYMQYLNGAEGPSSSSRQKEMVVENECGFSGKRESSYYSEPGDPLRTFFSDPITYVFSATFMSFYLFLFSLLLFSFHFKHF